jgi:DedD protein
MAESSSTQDALTRDQMALRRRARRRLVGAVAIALAAIVILPMLFDPEPKPLGPDVDIRIPARDTPFEPVPTAPPAITVAPEPTPQAAEPTQPAPAVPPATAAPIDKSPAAKPEKVAEEPAETPPPPAKPEHKVAEKPLAKPTGAFAIHGFYLQLGAFTNEDNAHQLIEKVTAAGFKPSLADSNGQFRVRVGPVPEKDRALEVQSRLKAKGFSSVMLGP